jgi:hypothetical protein
MPVLGNGLRVAALEGRRVEVPDKRRKGDGEGGGCRDRFGEQRLTRFGEAKDVVSNLGPAVLEIDTRLEIGRAEDEVGGERKLDEFPPVEETRVVLLGEEVRRRERRRGEARPIPRVQTLPEQRPGANVFGAELLKRLLELRIPIRKDARSVRSQPCPDARQEAIGVDPPETEETVWTVERTPSSLSRRRAPA